MTKKNSMYVLPAIYWGIPAGGGDGGGAKNAETDSSPPKVKCTTTAQADNKGNAKVFVRCTDPSQKRYELSAGHNFNNGQTSLEATIYWSD